VKIVNKLLVDVSHTVEDCMITYRGLPAPVICDYLSRDDSRQHYTGDTSFHIGKIEMVANTGTYLDSPFHRFENGKDLSELPLTSPCRFRRHPYPLDEHRPARHRGICLQRLEPAREGRPWCTPGGTGHWRSDRYFEGHPFLTAGAAEYLVDAGAALVGIDSLNIDDTADGPQTCAHGIAPG